MSETTPAPFKTKWRFVVLRHEMPQGAERPTHWDFMLETETGLRTWALAQEPASGRAIVAQALADHRAEYLTFEGPVSGGRGTVARFDAGTFAWEQNGATEIAVQLAGSRLRGQAVLTRDGASDQRWRFCFTADPV
jgi:DNA polymerase Ligase (LigD)